MMEAMAVKPSWGRRTRKVLLWIASILVALSVIAYMMGKIADYRQFKEDLTTYYGVKIGAPMAEVRYALNYPTSVEAETHDKTFPGNIVYDLGAKEGPTQMPANTQVEDYFIWEYSKDGHRTDVTFHKISKRVTEVSCYTDAEKGGQFCESLFGISAGTDESYIEERLGKPDHQKYDGPTKTVEYAALGLELVLSERKVYLLKKTGAGSAGLDWFLSHNAF